MPLESNCSRYASGHSLQGLNLPACLLCPLPPSSSSSPFKSPGPQSLSSGGSVSAHGFSLVSSAGGSGSGSGSVFAVPPPPSSSSVTTSSNVEVVVELNICDEIASDKIGSLVFCTTSPFSIAKLKQLNLIPYLKK